MESNILIKDARVIDLGGSFNGKKVSIRIENGIITEIGKDLKPKKSKIWEEENLCVSPGWMDGGAHFRDPGDEIKEGLLRGLDAAAAGGFTDVAILPSTNPPIDNKASVAYLKNRSLEGGAVTDAHPLGCISEHRKGTQLAEMLDMAEAGAIGFSDDGPLERAGLIQMALEYLRPSGDVLVIQPMEKDINPGATMHEGAMSTALGLKGSPTEAETMRLKRDLNILEYTGGRLHIPVISSADSVKLIKEAKKKGLAVTASTTPHHLTFTDEEIACFDGTYRVDPPLRAKSDRKALRAALAEGIIDSIRSDHRPENPETNDVEFVLSPNGMSGISSVFPVILSACEKADITRVIDSISNANRRVFNIPEVHIVEGVEAKLTLFNPKAQHICPGVSAGVNNPWKTMDELKGRVYGIVNGNRSYSN
ncbi:MAG: dihydroorotase [Euryarchaeota archaeon]|nr:dihydroorotase [Euryarchaeota archaeon]